MIFENHVWNLRINMMFIFLHVRRGDNVGREHLHPVPTFDYEKALEHFDSDSKVLFVSDDVGGVKIRLLKMQILYQRRIEQYDHECKKGMEYIKSFIPYVDLCLMSQCNGL